MTWLEFVIQCSWRATIVLAAACAAGALLRGSSAAVRHFVWTAAFAALLVLPAIIPVTPKWGIPAPAATGQPLQLAVEAPASGPAAAPGAASDVPGRVPGLLQLWILGCAGCALRFLIGAAGAWWMVRRSKPAQYARAMAEALSTELGISRRVRVVESASAPMPLAWGILRPVAILPSGAGEWPRPQLEAALLHELVHVRRFDVAAQALAHAACCLFWFHPLSWIGVRQLRKDRERACDDAVLRRGMAAPDYAERLLDMARALASRRSWADAAGMAEASDLEARVRALLDRRRNRQPLSRRVAAAVAAGGIVVLLAATAVGVHAQAMRGSLSGIVQDASGARVPNCDLTLANADGSKQEVTQANAAGEYRFGAISAGSYIISARSAGFAVTKKTVVVTEGTAARVDISLELGQVAESLTVTGKKPPTVTPSVRSPQRIPVGGNVQATRLISKVDPVYPPELQQTGVEGSVVLRAVISKEGGLLNLSVISTDVHPGLAQAALNAVQQWRYRPTLLNGQPVEVVTTITVAFRLE